MVYKRPKYVKTNNRNEITGPWLDNQFFTDSLQSQSSLSLNGDHNSILKNSLITLWDSLNTQQVYKPAFRTIACLCLFRRKRVFIICSTIPQREILVAYLLFCFIQRVSVIFYINKYRHNSILQFEIINKNDSFFRSRCESAFTKMVKK